MKFLDQLEQKAKAQKVEEERAAQATEERRAFFREVVDPTMRELFDNLKRLCEHLNYLSERAEISYPAPGYGKLTGRLSDDLRALYAGDDESRKITLLGTVALPQQSALQVVGPDIRRMREFVREYSLRGNERVRQDDRGRPISSTFRLEGNINLRGEIIATVDRPELVMTFINFHEFGSRRRIIQPEQIDEDLMDSLARFIAGVDPSFVQERLSEEKRQELKAQLDRERQNKLKAINDAREARRQAEEERNRRIKEEREQKEKKALAQRLSGRFKLRLEEVKRRIDED